MREEFGDQQAQIVFRVKPAADGPDYREQFLREIAPRLDTDNIFVADAEPYTQMQAQFEVLYGDTDKVNSQTIVVLFLLGNVFLGLIGTFWVRTRRRRSEIALRLAMGSTKQQVFSFLWVRVTAVGVGYSACHADMLQRRHWRVHHWTYRIDCHLAGGVEHDTLPDRLAGSLAVDSADGDDGHLVSGTASHEDRAGRGAA